MCVVVHNYVYTIEFASVYIFLFACRCGCMCTMYGGVRIMFVCSYVHVCMSKECVYVHKISVFIYKRSCDWLAGHHVCGVCV